jgi:hypothetical protein
VRVPSFLDGCVGVSVPKVNIYLGVAGIPFSYAGMFAEQWVLLSIGIGLLSVMPIAVGLQWIARLRIERAISHWPARVQVETNEQGERIAFVTTAGGGVSTLVLPDDYSPEQDGGEWFLRQVAPDLAEQVYGKEVDDE